jgi:hypothetical protein
MKFKAEAEYVNYSTLTDFSEMEFTVPGPGARDGIHKCFDSTGELSPSDVIRMMADIQEQQFARLGLRFRSLWGRPLQLVDCQNLFCEVSKYARCAHPDVGGLSGRIRIKKKYRMDPGALSPWYPPKWKINSRVRARYIKPAVRTLPPAHDAADL